MIFYIIIIENYFDINSPTKKYLYIEFGPSVEADKIRLFHVA